MRKFAAIIILATTAITGCQTCPKTIVSLDQLVDEHNFNAIKIPRLWARARLEITAMTKDGISVTWGSTSPLSSPNALLMMFKNSQPGATQDFALIGKEAGQEIFRMASSYEDDKYYLWYGMGGKSRGWWGRNSLAGAPGIKNLPMDPNQLLAALDICSLPANQTEIPFVALSMSTEPGKYAYVLSYIDRQPVSRRIMFRREMLFDWSDTAPRRLSRVNFFDDHGIRVMTAQVGDYKKIASQGVVENEQPEMPTDIKISWPQTGTSVHMVLSEMTTDDKANPEIVRFARLPSNAELTQVDKHLPASTKQPEPK